MRFFLAIGIIGFLGACEEPDDAEWARAVVLHEMTHWIGVHGHTDDRDSSMYPQMMGIDHYTGADAEYVCSQLGCSCGPDMEAKPIWIDSRCDDNVADLVDDAAVEINRFGQIHMCRDLVEVVGYTDDIGNVNVVRCNDGHSEGRIAHANERVVSLYPSVLFQ